MEALTWARETPGFSRANEIERLEVVIGEPVPARGNLFFHRQWNPQISGLGGSEPGEARLGDSDDGVVVALDVDGLANRLQDCPENDAETNRSWRPPPDQNRESGRRIPRSDGPRRGRLRGR